MQIFIATKNEYKDAELNRYFKNIGLKTNCILPRDIKNLKHSCTDYMCIREQTFLISKKTKQTSFLDKFEEVNHLSRIKVDIYKNGIVEKLKFEASVDGFVFPTLKTSRTDIFGWDDIFVSSRTMKTYQEMKDNGIKNSARDLAVSKMIDELPQIFKFDHKINLNFNPVELDEVISFEPFIKQLFDTNKYYSIAYENTVFRNIVNTVMNDGLFIRRASDRKQKNYWLPGLNAGIPLTPKKDELHELTFMFHDIMHFMFPDLVVVDDSKISKHKYIISRMMSEAFTLVLADMLFISVLKDSGVEYNYEKRKIYPLFEKIKFDISTESLPKIKELLWANTQFAVLGKDEPLKSLIGNDEAFERYKATYQRFFQEDYRWTHNNYDHISKDSKRNIKWLEVVKEIGSDIVPDTNTYCSLFDINDSLEKQVECIFKEMFSKVEKAILSNKDYNSETALSNAIKRYVSGQISLFFKFETLYNALFLEQILIILRKDILTNVDLDSIKDLYSVYLDKLIEDNYITEYEAAGFKNIYPMFSPFYVFYNKKEDEIFTDTFNDVFK